MCSMVSAIREMQIKPQRHTIFQPVAGPQAKAVKSGLAVPRVKGHMNAQHFDCQGRKPRMPPPRRQYRHSRSIICNSQAAGTAGLCTCRRSDRQSAQPTGLQNGTPSAHETLAGTTTSELGLYPMCKGLLTKEHLDADSFPSSNPGSRLVVV